MTHYLAATGLLLVAALAQSLVGPHLPLFGGRPDFVLTVVLAWAMLRGSGEGAVVGFVGGLLLDSVSYSPFGLNGALLGLTGYLGGIGQTNFYRTNLGFFLAAASAMTLLYHTATYLMLQALGLALPPVDEMYRLVLPSAVWNALLLVPVSIACRRLLRALAGWRQLKV